jgi:uncharacterized protein YecE (DUF72 family)
MTLQVESFGQSWAGMKIHIGTSGWHYKHWLDDVFYPAGTKPAQMFEFYAKHFDTVEINNSFYHLPSANTFDNWRDSAPRGFLFAVKASRFITHMKKLKDPQPSSEKFFNVVDRLENKLGPILFQLPPCWKVNVERFAEFLECLPHGRNCAVGLTRLQTGAAACRRSTSTSTTIPAARRSKTRWS